MPFIISKNSPTKWNPSRKLYYLVESYRDNTKVKRKTIFVLGEAKTLEECLQLAQQEEVDNEKRLAERTEIFDRFCKYGVVPAFDNPRYPTLFRRKYLKFIEDDKKELKKCNEKIQKIRILIEASPNISR